MTSYLRVNLSGTLPAGQFAVIAAPEVTLPAETLRFAFPLPQDKIQNGAPDGIALIDTVTGTVLDALSYEGSIAAAMSPGISGTVNLVEGTAPAATLADSSTEAGAPVRHHNGSDTNDAATDWAYATLPTLGTANIP